MRFLAVLVVEVSSVRFECRQQCHQLPEDLLVGISELRDPSLEQRVVADLHEMHSTSYEVHRISGNPLGNPLDDWFQGVSGRRW